MTANLEADQAAIQGYYRFIEKADETKVTPESLLHTHRQRTIERMRAQRTVLCIQDETLISYSTRTPWEGLEVIGRNQTSAVSQGVRLHATLAVTAAGLPLGLLRCAYGSQGGAHAPGTQRWVDGLRDTMKAAEQVRAGTRILAVMDREGDKFALFDAYRQQARVHLLVRARHNCTLEGGRKLFACMGAGAAKGYVEVPLGRLSRRVKAGRILHEGRTGRLARMAVRFRRVSLPPTAGFQGEPVPVWAIHIREASPPSGQKGVVWRLLTTCAVRTVAEAMEMVGYYLRRWRIADTFRVLKGGCKVEELGVEGAASLHRVITLYAVMAWRILLMTLLGRQGPETQAETVFTDGELRALCGFARRYGLPKVTNLQTAMLVTAMLGGYRNRKHEPPPGVKIMWRGYSRLEIGAAFYAAAAGPPRVQRE